MTTTIQDWAEDSVAVYERYAQMWDLHHPEHPLVDGRWTPTHIAEDGLALNPQTWLAEALTYVPNLTRSGLTSDEVLKAMTWAVHASLIPESEAATLFISWTAEADPLPEMGAYAQAAAALWDHQMTSGVVYDGDVGYDMWPLGIIFDAAAEAGYPLPQKPEWWTDDWMDEAVQFQKMFGYLDFHTAPEPA